MLRNIFIETSNQRFVSLFLCLVFTVLAWATSFTGIIRELDDIIYDKIVFFNKIQSSDGIEHAVFFVEMRPDEVKQGDPYWNRFLKNLLKSGAETLVFEFIPEKVTSSFFEELSKFPVAVFNNNLPAAKKIKAWITLNTSRKQSPRTIRFAPFTIPPAENGIHRAQELYEITADGKLPKVEFLVYTLLKQKKLHSASESYRINFIDYPGNFPHISGEKVTAGELIPELLKKRVVFISKKRLSPEIGLSTPITPDGKNMPVFRFLGLCLDTLLRGRSIQQPSQKNILSLFIGLFIILALLYSIENQKWVMLFTGLFLGVSIVASWLLFVYAHLLLPLVEILLLQFLCYCSVTTFKKMVHENAIRKILLNVSSSEKNEYPWWTGLSKSILGNEDNWNQITKMLIQVFNFKRSIFLQKVKGSHRVREVNAYNCSLEEINENRRNYERAPYSGVISANKAVEVKNYLSSGDENERQYMVPLSFAGQITGFWVFGMDKTDLKEIVSFEAVIASFASQIGEILFRYEQYQSRKGFKKSWISRILSGQKIDINRNLIETLISMDTHTGIITSVFETIHSATIMYDLFGNVLRMNKKMEEQMKIFNINPFELSVLDFICALTASDTESVRKILRNIILREEQATLYAKFDDDNKLAFITISPVIKGKKTGEARSTISPFNLMGIIVELAYIGDIKRKNDLKEDLILKIFQNLKDDLSFMQNKNKQFTQESTFSANCQNAICLKMFLDLKSALNDSFRFMNSMEKFLETNLYEGKSRNLYPINSKRSLVLAWEKYSNLSQEKNISFDLTGLRDIPFILADPEYLDTVFSDIIFFLLEDSVRGTRIAIQGTEDGEKVVFSFKNSGYGIPQERLQHLLKGKEIADSDHYKLLREIQFYVSEWGGDFTAKSSVGEGYNFIISLSSAFSMVNRPNV